MSAPNLPASCILDTCAECGEPVYLNQHPERQVEVWVHRATGARFCDLTELRIAKPITAVSA